MSSYDYDVAVIGVGQGGLPGGAHGGKPRGWTGLLHPP